jgi:hypothetical protein
MDGWKCGKPAQPGWFVASAERNAEMRRYWDGQEWSAPVWGDAPNEQYTRARHMPSQTQAIEWREMLPSTLAGDAGAREAVAEMEARTAGIVLPVAEVREPTTWEALRARGAEARQRGADALLRFARSPGDAAALAEMKLARREMNALARAMKGVL